MRGFVIAKHIGIIMFQKQVAHLGYPMSALALVHLIAVLFKGGSYFRLKHVVMLRFVLSLRYVNARCFMPMFCIVIRPILTELMTVSFATPHKQKS